VPAVKQTSKAETERKLIPISDLPSWAQKAFPESMSKLNLIQSKLYPAAFKSPENLLVCAPTGAGKTNIAMLSILQILSQKRRQNGTFDIKSFKIVYIAPMKALVSEIVGSF
jgi:pre-mRNA-splicing helicase BRR2